MASAEKHVLSATIMAIEEINQSGGLLGQQIQAIVKDGRSDPQCFAEQAETLLTVDKAVALFGCWTSSSRKAVKPVVERHRSLLWYPIQYEGLEQSPHIIYTGSCLNQQICPAVEWALAQGVRRVFLIGSDYVFPRTANSLIQTIVVQSGGQVVHEQYVPLSWDDFAGTIDLIRSADVDMVLNTINGDSNLAFFREYAQSGLDAGKVPILSFSFSEIESADVKEEAAGHYACWSYFQGTDSAENHRFLANYGQRFGDRRCVSDPVVTAYTQVYLWKHIAETANSLEAADILRNAPGMRVSGPGGWMEVQRNHHVRKPALIGRAENDGQFRVVWESESPIDPKPWLGLEDTNLPFQELIQEAMERYPEAVHLNWQLEQEMARRELAEESVRHSENRLRLLFEQAPVAIELSRQGAIVDANPVYVRLFGYDHAEQVIGTPLVNQIAPHCRQEILERSRRHDEGQSVVQSYETTGLRRDGTQLPIQVQVNYVSLPEGVSKLVFITDLSERKRAEEALRSYQQQLEAQNLELRQLSLAIEQSGSTVVITDLDGNIQYANPRFEQTTGYTVSEVIGQNPRILKSGNTSAEYYQTLWETITSGQIWQGQFHNRRQDGTLYWESATIAPVHNSAGQITSYIAIKEDITEQRKAQEALRQYAKQLAARNEELDAFAHTVAHDLKNPISIAVGFAGILAQDYDTMSPRELASVTRTILQAGQRLDRIVDELMLLTGVRRQEIIAEALDMGRIVRESIARLQMQIQDRKAQIALPEDSAWPVALGYAPWVEEVWANYIDNACKYGGKPPEIALGAVAQPDGQTRFWVRDNGPGLTAEAQGRLFTPFTRLGQVPATGHGLGLSIVRRIVEKLGGQVGVESSPGQGSVFYFTLPTIEK